MSQFVMKENDELTFQVGFAKITAAFRKFKKRESLLPWALNRAHCVCISTVVNVIITSNV